MWRSEQIHRAIYYKKLNVLITFTTTLARCSVRYFEFCDASIYNSHIVACVFVCARICVCEKEIVLNETSSAVALAHIRMYTYINDAASLNARAQRSRARRRHTCTNHMHRICKLKKFFSWCSVPCMPFLKFPLIISRLPSNLIY